MISAFANSFKVPDLRSRILFTLAMIVIVRIGASITLPGVDVTVLDDGSRPVRRMQALELPRWLLC